MVEPAPAVVVRTGPLAVLRVGQWLHLLPLPAAAMAPRDLPQQLPALAIGVAAAAGALAFAYGANALADRSTDLDAVKNPLVSADPTPLDVGVVAAAAALALALGVGAGPRACAAVLLSLASAALYSLGPRAKVLPGLGTLLNVGIFAPLLLVAPAGLPLPAALPCWMAAFVALLLQNQLLHERADAAEDAHAGTLTTGRWLGESGTRRLAAVVGLVGSAVATALAPDVGLAMATTAALGTAAVLCLAAPGPAAVRRVLHRRFAIVAGAILYATGHAAGAGPS